MKGFQKILKKQHKEKETLKKKHNKEKQLMQKNHSAAIDKLTTIYNKKQNLNVNNNNNNNDCANNQPNSARSSRSSKRSNQENNDKDKIGELVEEQTRIWVALVERQVQEEKQLNKDHIDQQCNSFEQLLVEAQKQRVKFIEQKQTKEVYQLQANQAKKSVEDTKRLKAEKDLRSKQERDRRVRELNSTNTKTFIDERKRLLFKHSQVTNSLLTISKEELELLKEENTKAKELSMCLNEEFEFSQSPSSVC